MRVIVFEDAHWRNLTPLVYTRPTCRLKCGTSDLLHAIRWLVAEADEGDVEIWCRPQVEAVTGEETRLQINQKLTAGTLLLNGSGHWKILPAVGINDTAWVGRTEQDAVACVYVDEGLAGLIDPPTPLDENNLAAVLNDLPSKPVGDLVRLMQWPWDLVKANGDAIEGDWSRHRHSAAVLGHVDSGCRILGEDAVFVGDGSVLDPGVVVDARNGPVWIGSDVHVFPNSYVQGPACLGDESQLLPGTILREGCTVGPNCKVGGEVAASILHECSNKQHHGFLGHSYLGAWVNIGAGSSNSNLKNTYGTVAVPVNGRLVESNEQFVGLFAGDHSKIGINVAFPTGAVVGFCSSIFRSRSPKFVPSFSWLDQDREEKYDPARGLEVARRVSRRRDREMSPAQEKLFLEVASTAADLEANPSPAAG
jgi:UDP-N-acetylglucosamine diphosphorylase/glucosamine-1-phosphate N-acetyltransferase